MSFAGQIDLVCDQFEMAWRSGSAPRIEEYLAPVPPDQREKLLGELLEIELDLRQRSGEFLKIEEYRGPLSATRSASGGYLSTRHQVAPAGRL